MYTIFLGIFYSEPDIEHSHYHLPSTRDHFGSAYNSIETKNVRHRNERKTLSHRRRGPWKEASCHAVRKPTRDSLMMTLTMRCRRHGNRTPRHKASGANKQSRATRVTNIEKVRNHRRHKLRRRDRAKAESRFMRFDYVLHI